MFPINSLHPLLVLLLTTTLLVGCSSVTPEKLLRLPSDAAAMRQMQSTSMAAESEAEILEKVVTLLQDMGFQITYAKAELGIITGEKGIPFHIHFSEGMSEITRTGFTFGMTAKQPALPFRVGIIATTHPDPITNGNYEVRIKVYRVWRRGPHHEIFFIREYENASLYRKLFRRISAVTPD